MTNGLSISVDLIVAFPFVGIDRCFGSRTAVNVRAKALPVRAAKHLQAHLPARSANGTDNWGAVVFIRSVSPGFVGSPARRIGRISMRFAFFPPRSETSRRSRSGRRAPTTPVEEGQHSPGAAGGCCGPSFGSNRALGPSERCFSPDRFPAVAAQPSQGEGAAPRRLFRCRGCRSGHTPYSARPEVDWTSSGGSGRPPASRPHSVDTAARRDGSADEARFGFDHRRQDRREESPSRHPVSEQNKTSIRIGPVPPLHSFWT